MFEREAARRAPGRAVAEEVRGFAAQVEEDHADMAEALRRVADGMGVRR